MPGSGTGRPGQAPSAVRLLTSRRVVLGMGAVVLLGGAAAAYREFRPIRMVSAPSLGGLNVSLPPLPGLARQDGTPPPGVSTADFAGRVTVLNVWASWCPTCRGEHEELTALARDSRFTLVGVAYKDDPGNALAYLRRAGVPFAAVSVDSEGLVAGHLNVVGLPATFVIDGAGEVVHRIEGGLNARSISRQLMPAVERAMARTAG